MSTATEDLEIFILTHNRAEMLRHAITSCLEQSIKDLSITILDNASTDHTREVVASFQGSNIHYLPTKENIGGLGNIQRCQHLCSKKYVMIFHDDDQLHPEYIERAYARLHKNQDANIIVSNAKAIPARTAPDYSEKQNNPVLKLDKIHFSAALYVRNKIAFCSAIYRKEALQSLHFEDLKTRFGKWGDRPIMIEAVGSGSAILMTDAYVYSGRHDMQDTHFKETQPPHTLWLNREQFFRNILGEKLSGFPGLCFLAMNARRLKSGFKRRIAKGVAFDAYLGDAFSMGATTKSIWAMRWLTPRLVQRVVDFYSKHYLKKNFRI